MSRPKSRALALVRDQRSLCEVCGHHRAQGVLGLCSRCEAAHLDLAAFDAATQQVRGAAR